MRDDSDIERETKCLFSRCNILMSRFKYCLWPLKLKLFQSYLLIDAALWNSHNKVTLDRFVSWYNKCVKGIFGFPKYSSLL